MAWRTMMASLIAVVGMPAAATSALAQALVLGASGPAATRFPIGARIAAGQRIALGTGDSLLILEQGHSRRLTGPMARYTMMSADRTTTLGLLAQVAKSSSLKVREQDARHPAGARPTRVRSGAGVYFDVAAITAKPYDRPSSPLIADPRQDDLPMARIVPGEVRHLCLTRDEPLFIARDPRDDGRATARLTVVDATVAGSSVAMELAPGEMWRALPAAWRRVAKVRIEAAGGTSTLPGADGDGEATVAAFDLVEDRPEGLLSLYAGEACGHQAQQLYRVLRAEMGQ